MTIKYVLLLAAEADLRDIVRCTHKEWGHAQARRYMAMLKLGIERIVAGQSYKDLAALYPTSEWLTASIITSFVSSAITHRGW